MSTTKCTTPVTAWQYKDQPPVFRKPYGPDALVFRELKLPCGKCPGCRFARVEDWVNRCVLESKQHPQNSYVTLTYNDQNLPPDGALCHADFQLFMKRFRKAIAPLKVRFFMCGEYGSTGQRAHYHAIFFGYQFPDLVPIGRTGDNISYGSQMLSDLWGKGFVKVGEVTPASIQYVAGYTLKKAISGMKIDPNTGELVPEPIIVTPDGVPLPPEYQRMSNQPGIGYNFFEQYESDVFPHDFIVMNGLKKPVPKYFSRKYRQKNVDGYEALRNKRVEHGLSKAEDNTPERLAVKADIQRSKLVRALKKRG
jgi:hypothetical protein